MGKDKFAFDTLFQQEILHYVIKNPQGILVLRDLKDNYFTLISHQVIAKSLKKYFKTNKRVPNNKATLRQEIKEILENKTISDLVIQDDVVEINSIVDNLYNNPLTDSEYIYDKINKFFMYVEMKNLNDSLDLSDFSQYEEYQQKLSKILNKAQDKKDNPIYLVKDCINRQLTRQSDPTVIPTPFRQLNHLTNAGGYPKGSIIVALDKSKATKTFTLVNVARAYLRMRKVVLYIDTENGANEIMTRMEQSSLNKSKSELLSGDFDKLEQKHIRKIKRLGSEFIIRKIPANIGNANDIGNIIDDIYNNEGLKVNVIIADYMGKMGSIGKQEGDFERISNVYIEMSNLAVEKDIDAIWTAQHVTRQAEVRRLTRYEDGDIAKCIDISRHASAVFGLNSTDEERDNGIQRWEMIVQRDGPSFGRCLFNINLDTQRLTEFTVAQRKAYDDQVAPNLDKQLKSNNQSKGKFKNPNAGKGEESDVKDV